MEMEEELNWFAEEPSSSKSSNVVKSVSKTELKKVKKKKDEDDKTKTKVETKKISTADDLLERRALCPSEKLNILEDRDKYLRIKLDKVSNLRVASATKGICPDMCPEKERILRDVRGIVSYYETLDNSTNMDHRRAVKEYARSSADQEEPLPHELRPEPVLTMTMEYLVSQIMCKIDNETEDNFGNWYDFCWGRLRAIRKDIIQQQLCDLNTVTIVEQCARFHILCFDRLWGRPKSIFEDKINSETLMNCLQSLMHMYEDLRKQGVLCPNEAEFRAYMILLKLNSGFVLSEYQQFSFDIQQSKEVRDAVDIHSAYSNNLYSTFFALLRRTSYLNSCLMQRFFDHLRSQSLEIIVRAHGPPNKMSKLPVDYIQRILKFDSYDDCVMFCEHFGLAVTDDGLNFVVSRSEFYYPETMFVVETPSSLVAKKRVSVAEAVLGHSDVPIFLDHQVHDSFNEDGTLAQGAVDASDQEEKMLRDVVERKLIKKRLQEGRTDETASFEVPMHVSFASVPRFSFDDSQSDDVDMARNESDTYDEVDVEMVYEPSISEDPTSSESDSEEESFEDAVSVDPVVPPVPATPKLPIETTPKYESFFKPKKSPPITPVPAKVVTSPPPSSYFSFRFAPSVPPVEVKSCKPRTPKSEPPPSALKPKDDRNRVLLGKLRKRVCARKYTRLWKRKVEKIRSARENRKQDSTLCPMSIKDYLELWGTSKNECKTRTLVRLEKNKRLDGLVVAILRSNYVDRVDEKTKLVGSKVAEKLGQVAVTSALKFGSIQPLPVFWKLVISLPPPIEEGSSFPDQLKLWCKTAFYSDPSSGLGDVDHRVLNSGVRIFTCVQIVEGTKDVGTVSKNLSALIVVTAQGWETPQQTSKRISLIASHAREPIPASLLVLGEKKVNVSPLNYEKISYYDETIWNKPDHLSLAIIQLASRTYVYHLKIQPLGALIEAMAEKLLDALHEDKYLNESLDIVLSNPNHIIQFYNTLVDGIHSEIEQSCSYNYYGLACEFEPSIKKFCPNYRLFPEHYHDPRLKSTLADHMKSTKLPELDKWPFLSSLDLLEHFRAYCDSLGTSNVLSKLMRLVNPPDDDRGLDLPQYLEQTQWLPIVEILIKQRLNKKELFNFRVVYREDKIKELLTSHWWLFSDPVKKVVTCFV